MTTYSIRPLNLDTDTPALADIRNEVFPEPITAKEYRSMLEKVSAQTTILRIVAVDESDKPVGLAGVSRDPWDIEGHWFSTVRVSKALRGRGIGSMLHKSLEAFALERGGKVMYDDVRDQDDYSLEWAKRKGFAIDRHLFESTLDLATFDEHRFAGAVERTEATGIRFALLSELDVDLWGPRAYELVRHAVLDIPGVPLEEFAPYDEWAKWALDPEILPRDCFILAIDGERVVGMTALAHQKTSGAMYTDLTGVHREYRGRGLALALKMVSVQCARRYNAPYMRTNNDSENAPMLAVNRKMGYEPKPGIYKMKKRLV